MKDVGCTSEGNRLVEMSSAEYKALENLCLAVEGKNVSDCFMRPSDQYSFRDSYDFSSVFEVILAFYHTKFKITELQSQIDMMEDSLNNE